MSRLQRIKDIVDEITPIQLSLALGAFSLLIVGAGTCSSYGSDKNLPPPRAAPMIPKTLQKVSFRYQTGFYGAIIQRDAKKLDLEKISVIAMQEPLAHRLEFKGRQRLKIGGRLKTPSLVLQARKRKIWVGEAGQGFRAAHLTLRITNRTARPLAYRVVTKLSGKCDLKQPLSHNSLALLPGKSAERTECLQRDSHTLTIELVETMDLTALGYEYITRLNPMSLQFHGRPIQGHQGGRLAECKVIPWRSIRGAMTSGDAAWRDVIDYYARHSCEEYSFFSGYRWNKEGSTRLPALPPSEQ